ncbi:MAG: winged helix-turn-helix domain-containing protein [Chloroflexi bacterium]|nr:winged helix-turn-helix domain-containing protein [Chloroflexota bacterium]
MPPVKARSLFQYLVSRPNRLVARETLIDALWPDPDAQAAFTSLKVAVHALRQLLSETVVRDAGLAVVARGNGYALTATDLWLDIDEFQRRCAQAHRLDAGGRVDEALVEYTRAAELYRGNFLEESPEEWVLVRREGLKDHLLLVLARIAEIALAQADYHTCIARCQQLLEHDCCREDIYRTLMQCHAQLGQRGRVRRWYELCTRTLRAELDVAPELETEALYQRAMAGKLSTPSAASRSTALGHVVALARSAPAPGAP